MKKNLLILILLFFSKLNSQTTLVYDEQSNEVLAYIKNEDNDFEPYMYSKLSSNSNQVNIYNLNEQLIFYYKDRSIYFKDGTKIAYVEFDDKNGNHIFFDNNNKKKIGYIQVLNNYKGISDYLQDSKKHVVSEVYNRNNELIHQVIADSTVHEFKIYSQTLLVMSYLPLLFKQEQ